jgi:hypothetical protein
MDLYFQGMDCANKGRTSEYLAQACSFCERALAHDPGNIEALVGMAMVDTLSVAVLGTDDRVTRLAVAKATLTKALSMAPNRIIASLVGHRPNPYQPRGPRHCRMRAGVGAGSKSSHRSREAAECRLEPLDVEWSRASPMFEPQAFGTAVAAWSQIGENHR